MVKVLSGADLTTALQAATPQGASGTNWLKILEQLNMFMTNPMVQKIAGNIAGRFLAGSMPQATPQNSGLPQPIMSGGSPAPASGFTPEKVYEMILETLQKVEGMQPKMTVGEMVGFMRSNEIMVKETIKKSMGV